MIKAIGYVRVSTEEQAKEGLSIDAQIAKINAYATLNDMDLVDVIVDAGKSAKNTKRDGLQALLRRIETGEAACVVTCKLDRLSRRVVDTLTLIERIEAAGAGFHSIAERVDTKSAIGKFFLCITASYAEMERNIVGERVSEVLAYKKTQGEWVGSVPYGFQVQDKKLVPADEHKHAVQLVSKLRQEGKTLRAIAGELNRLSIPAPRGGNWHASSVKHLLDRMAA